MHSEERAISLWLKNIAIADPGSLLIAAAGTRSVRARSSDWGAPTTHRFLAGSENPPMHELSLVRNRQHWLNDPNVCWRSLCRIAEKGPHGGQAQIPAARAVWRRFSRSSGRAPIRECVPELGG